MKITKVTEETLVRKTTEIDVGNGTGVVVIDFVNDSEKVVDTIYRDAATGYELDDVDAISEIETFMAEQDHAN